MKKKLLIALACILAVIGTLCAIYYPDSNINNTIGEIQEQVIEEINEIIVTKETQEIVNETIEATENNEDLSTTEIIESSEEEEQNITDEGALETDAVVEQENISYDGDSTGNGVSLLGAYQGLTYYSQADSRWSNIMYSSTRNTSQTMKSSACGPTSAAMVVSSSKGAILPTTLAQLAVDNNFRTASNGTAWAFFPFIADYFNFKEYYTTSSFDTAMSYLKQKYENGNSKYYIIASCGSGLFTTGGHYIVLSADNGETITVYDPYLYNGKFETASRRAAGVIVSGNSVFVSESSFETYANYKHFWIFSNDSTNDLKNGTANVDASTVSFLRYVATQSSNLNVRNAPNGSLISSLKKGTQVTVTRVDGNWSYITSPTQGWVSSSYLSSSIVTTTSVITNTVGQTKKLTKASILYGNSNLTGTKYNYKANTTIKILSNISSYIDKVKVNTTNRIAYINTNNYINSSNTSSNNIRVKSTVGQYKRLKYKTTLYSKSNLTGSKYNYLANTQVKIIKNINSNVDYVYIVKTKKYLYVRKDAYI